MKIKSVSILLGPIFEIFKEIDLIFSADLILAKHRMPKLYFFRHNEGLSGVAAGTQFGPKYFKKYWDKACKNLNIEGVGLYGGTKHTVATALGQMLSPEEIKRGGTGSATNKAFDRYYQPQNREKIKVQTAIKKLKKKARTNGEVIPLERTRRRR